MITRTRTSAVAIGIFFMACLLSCNRQPQKVDFEAAKKAYEKYDYQTALKGIKPRAEQGDVSAQRLLGEMYESGQGVPKNPQEALRLYRLAAEQKDAEAEKLVAEIYDEGKGVPTDKSEALKWFRRSSEHGNGAASFALGDKYYRGNGVAADRYEAVRLGALSAKQGEMWGYFLAEGAYNPKEPQPQDPIELRKWLKFGADNGVATAQVSLGAMYYDGDGVARNYTEAMRLFTLAAKQEGEWTCPHF
jgi:hypothetical protein